MSMLSAKCDELRAWSQMIDSVNAGSELGKVLQEAANIIWYLNDERVKQNAENIELKSEVEKCRDRCGKLGFKKYKLEKQLGELRELCVDMCEDMRISCNFDIPISRGTVTHARNRMIENGIEVDG